MWSKLVSMVEIAIIMTVALSMLAIPVAVYYDFSRVGLI